MSLRYFDPLLRTNDLVQDLKWDETLRHRFEVAEPTVLSSYQLTDEERTAILARDYRRLYEIGVHPYLLSQLARLIHGTGEKSGTSSAATALIRSLLGDNYESYMAGRSG